MGQIKTGFHSNATHASASQYEWSIETANHRSSQSNACVACGFRLRNARIAIDCVVCIAFGWKPGFNVTVSDSVTDTVSDTVFR